MEAVTEDASPRGAITFVLWEPPLLAATPDAGPAGPSARTPAEDTPAGAGDVIAAEQPIRRSALAETADLLADAVTQDIRTLSFVPLPAGSGGGGGLGRPGAGRGAGAG